MAFAHIYKLKQNCGFVLATLTHTLLTVASGLLILTFQVTRGLTAIGKKLHGLPSSPSFVSAL